MAVGFEKLLSIMDQELVKYQSLLALARRKADLLSSRAPVSQVEEIVEAEAALVADIVRQEQIRLAVMRELTTGLGLKPNATLLDVAEATGGETSETLTGVGDATVKLLKELREVNRFNEALLSQELAWVNFSLDLYTNRDAGNPGTYSHAGRALQSPGSNSVLLDARA